MGADGGITLEMAAGLEGIDTFNARYIICELAFRRVGILEY